MFQKCGHRHESLSLQPNLDLSPGFAFGLQVDNENGQPWDSDKTDHREKCLKMIQDQKPLFIIGSPMCTAFSILQGLNKWTMDSKKWNALWGTDVRHMRFVCQNRSDAS